MTAKAGQFELIRQETLEVRHHLAEEAERHPLLDHPLAAASRFRAADLVASVRRIRGLQGSPVPQICILEFDGDLTDALVARSEARPFPVGLVAHVTNGSGESQDFDKGSSDTDYRLLQSVCRGCMRFLDRHQNPKRRRG